MLIAEFSKGLGHYRLNHTSRSIDLIKRYKKDDLDIEMTYVVDVNTNYVNYGEIYVLDAKKGLIKIQYNRMSK